MNSINKNSTSSRKSKYWRCVLPIGRFYDRKTKMDSGP